MQTDPFLKFDEFDLEVRKLFHIFILFGRLTSRDLMGDRPIKHIQAYGGKHDELVVRDCMTPVAEIDVLSLSDVLKAEVGHIVATLKNVGRQHALVVDTDPTSGEERVRGIFSISQIGRQLGMPLQTFEVANTFSQIEVLLAT